MNDLDSSVGSAGGGLQSALAEAERVGFDLSLIDASLGYGYDQRALQHQAALDLATELQRAGRALRGGA